MAGPAAAGTGRQGSARDAGGGTGAASPPILRRATSPSVEQSADVVGGLPVAGGKGETLSPQRRWEAAVAARPLEAPQALPARFHALASAVTGTALPPRYTTGPATRHALASAGALGATTGSVVHLPAPPARVPASVLAHELSHARQPVRRPRFLLASMSGAIDDDERGALAAGRGLLTNGANGGGLLGNGANGTHGASGPETGAGLVDRLPVGGGVGAVGAVTEVATRAARAAVIEAGASPFGGAGTGGPGLDGMGPGAMGPGGMGLGAMGPGGAGFGAPAGGFSGGGGSGAPASPPDGRTSGSTGGGTATSGVDAETASGAAAAGTSGGNAGVDMDMVVEAVEERLLREIERRGGRWAGVF
ncbi:hypothetical protein Pa4123_60060 [Phytohabitans aurantiacus]|uniref:eCIS core domain-containing protein n=2 Tax=Phytohabitans aurantiacus TaxID=3016789 RepID=A0ABQ5R2S9_9ACTN|nr:hypothetical protein Pa4123_60060 [Phytohabitans aurantiacus]